MESLPAKLFGMSLNARFDAVSGVRVSRLVVPPSVFLRPVGDDGSVIQPNKVDAALGQRPATDPSRTTAQSQQLILLRTGDVDLRRIFNY